MDIILSASILAAFLAGAVALFAPCCITVLLPSYLASTFKERKKILRMTFVFFSGIAAILIPIGLGAAWLADTFQSFHTELYIFGGVLMVVFAFLAFLGKGFSILPLPKHLRENIGDSGKKGGKSVFLLGLFSGAATSCCAPVLAGAMTLAVMSGVFWKAMLVTFAYVFGMTFPLFLLAYFYDKFHVGDSWIMKNKEIEFRFFGKRKEVTLANLAAGVIFFSMGVTLMALAFSGNTYWAPESQVEIGKKLSVWSESVFSSLSVIPDFAWVLFILAIFAFFLFKSKKNKS